MPYPVALVKGYRSIRRIRLVGRLAFVLVPRRPPDDGKKVPRKAKGHKRPRRYHHGREAGRINDAKLEAVAPAFAAAEADQAEAARVSSEHRALVRDFEEVVAGLARVAPCARAPLPLVLL